MKSLPMIRFITKSQRKISHLRVFGCVVYPLKLNNKDEKFAYFEKKDCILIGYGEKEGNLDKNTIKALRSRDVQFNEYTKHSAEETEFEISRNEDQTPT